MQVAVQIAWNIAGRLKELREDDRILVFVTRLEHGHLMAEKLNCDFYRGSSDQSLTDSRREAMVQHWRNARTYFNKVMVATDAFGPGNDYPHVRDVWFVGTPRGLVDMAQMAGRGGRDGDMAQIHFERLEDLELKYHRSDVDGHLGHEGLDALMKKPFLRCWREVLGAFLDGSEKMDCATSEFNWPCPKCLDPKKGARPESWIRRLGGVPVNYTPTLPPAQLITKERVLSPQVGATRMRAPSTSLALPSLSGTLTGTGQAFVGAAQKAKRFKDARTEKYAVLVERITVAANKVCAHCTLCHVAGKGLVMKTSQVLDCAEMRKLDQTPQAVKQGGSYLDWKRRLRYAKSAATCWRCHLPFLEDTMHKAKRTLETGKVDHGCNPLHEDMVMPVVYWAYMDSAHRPELEEKFGRQWRSD